MFLWTSSVNVLCLYAPRKVDGSLIWHLVQIEGRHESLFSNISLQLWNVLSTVYHIPLHIIVKIDFWQVILLVCKRQTSIISDRRYVIVSRAEKNLLSLCDGEEIAIGNHDNFLICRQENEITLSWGRSCVQVLLWNDMRDSYLGGVPKISLELPSNHARVIVDIPHQCRGKWWLLSDYTDA